MDYSNFRRSDNIEGGSEVTPQDQRYLAEYRAELMRRGLSDSQILARLLAPDTYIPLQPLPSLQQLARQLGRSLGLRDSYQHSEGMRWPDQQGAAPLMKILGLQ